jgi:ferredoxin
MKANTPLSLFIASAAASSSAVVVSAFSAAQPTQIRQQQSTSATQLHIFGNAFKNDDSLGKPQNAGLTNGPKFNEVTINGKPVKGAVAGQKVSKVMASARVKMTYSCREGNCGTCELLMNGRVEKACVAKLPQGKCTIQTYN